MSPVSTNIAQFQEIIKTLYDRVKDPLYKFWEQVRNDLRIEHELTTADALPGILEYGNLDALSTTKQPLGGGWTTFTGWLYPNVEWRPLSLLDYVYYYFNKYDTWFERFPEFRLGLHYLAEYYVHPQDAEIGYTASPKIKEVKINRDVWNKAFENRMSALLGTDNYSPKEVGDIIRNVGSWLYTNKKDHTLVKDFDQWAKDLEEYIKREKLSRALSSLIASVLTAGLAQDVAEDTGHPIIDELSSQLNEVFGPEKLIETGVDVLVDTMTDSFDESRRILVEWMEEADERTAWNLSAVTELLNDGLRVISENSTKFFEDATGAILNDLYDRISGVDQELQDPNSKARQAQEEINLSNGLGFALGIQRILFKTKGTD